MMVMSHAQKLNRSEKTRNAYPGHRFAVRSVVVLVDDSFSPNPMPFVTELDLPNPLRDVHEKVETVEQAWPRQTQEYAHSEFVALLDLLVAVDNESTVKPESLKSKRANLSAMNLFDGKLPDILVLENLPPEFGEPEGTGRESNEGYDYPG